MGELHVRMDNNMLLRGRFMTLCFLPPHLPRGLDDDSELVPLVFDRDPIADDRGGEATLWAQCQSVERDDAAGLFQAARQLLRRFPTGALGGDEAQDHRLVFGDVT